MSAWQARVRQATTAFLDGRFVVIIDDVEDCAYLATAAESTQSEQVNFMASRARGLISVALTGGRAATLDLPSSGEPTGDRPGFTVSVEASTGVTTGISAADRARTIRVLASPETTAADLVRPGHVFPIRAHANGVLGLPAVAEASIELARRAELAEVTVVCAILRDDGELARGATASGFARRHRFPVVRVGDLVRMRLSCDKLVQRVCESYEDSSSIFQTIVFRTERFNAPYVALFAASKRNARPMIYLQRSCNAFGVLATCTCSEQAAEARAKLSQGGGVIICLPEMTLDHLPGGNANRQPPPPPRSHRFLSDYYAISVQIARYLGVGSKCSALAESADLQGLKWHGLNVTTVAARTTSSTCRDSAENDLRGPGDNPSAAPLYLAQTCDAQGHGSPGPPVLSCVSGPRARRQPEIPPKAVFGSAFVGEPV